MKGIWHVCVCVCVCEGERERERERSVVWYMVCVWERGRGRMGC